MTADAFDFLDVDDLDRSSLTAVLDRAADYKRKHAAGIAHPHLERRTLAMLFEKPSTRTRVSFEAGMTQLGGHAIFLGVDDIQLGRGEPVADTARSLSRYVDAIMARVFDHGDVEALAANADVPVINALTDAAHPCQTLADLLTIREHFGRFDGITAAWVGDANNVARSFVLGCALVGIDLRVATPPAFALDEPLLERAAELGRAPAVETDPTAAVDGADVIYTDVWISMGQEDERAERLEAFEGFQVNEALLAHGEDPVVMHCLPANRGEEITAAVLEGERSIVFEQAENRLHAQKGLLAELLLGR